MYHYSEMSRSTSTIDLMKIGDEEIKQICTLKHAQHQQNDPLYKYH